MYTRFDIIRRELENAIGRDCKVHLLVNDAWYVWSAVVRDVNDNFAVIYRNPTPTQQGQRVEVPLAWVMAVE